MRGKNANDVLSKFQMKQDYVPIAEKAVNKPNFVGIIFSLVILFVMCSTSNVLSGTNSNPTNSSSNSSSNSVKNESVTTNKTKKNNSSKPKLKKSQKWNGSPATEKDYDNVTTYATIIGRAVACGENISEPSKRVGTWMDRTFSPSEKSTQVQVYATAIEYAATQQQLGESPDSCPSAIRAFQKTRWP
jgi:hypothetical protein